jgi:SAM-dependent methyltransferase
MAVYERPTDHTYLDIPISDRHHHRIIRHLVDRFGLRAGDRVVELGAGTGRYTRLLLEAGLKVTVVEPDRLLVDQLERNLAGQRDLEVINDFPTNLALYPQDARAVCGFHVLHHIRGEERARLYEFLDLLVKSRPCIGSWFFLEPNPFSPLWLLAVLFQRGQSFREERGIWERHVRACMESCEDIREGCGWLPPRPWVAWFGKLAELGTAPYGPRAPWRIYQVTGGTRKALHHVPATRLAGAVG